MKPGKKGGKGKWAKIGAAWPHKDGKGFDVVLDVLPLDGRVKLREEVEKEPQSQ